MYTQLIYVWICPGSRVVATVGGAGWGRPALTISARHNPKKNDFRPAQFFFFFF